MHILDVKKAHHGLQLEYGLEAVWMSDRSSSSAIDLLGNDGSPITIGWFDNSAPSKPSRAKDQYAITTWPAKPTHKFHRLMVNQPLNETARLVETDDSGYLEGYDSQPLTLHSKTLNEQELDETVRGLLSGAYVLSITAGDAITAAITEPGYTVDEVKGIALRHIVNGDYLDVLTEAKLAKLATTPPPALG